jgi:DNA-directed RNA polymerase specialized sigma24 family protein
MSNMHSVSGLLQELGKGESQAARQVWDRYIQRLVGAARKQLKNLPRRAADEEDVAVSAFDAFFRGVQEDRFKRLENRDDLWQILVMLAERKAVAVMRRELADKRGGGKNRGESVFEQMAPDGSMRIDLDQMGDPNPVMVQELTLEVRERLDQLDDDDVLRKIAIRKLEGYTNQEIADQLDSSLRAIERKLQLIRRKWQ